MRRKSLQSHSWSEFVLHLLSRAPQPWPSTVEFGMGQVIHDTESDCWGPRNEFIRRYLNTANKRGRGAAAWRELQGELKTQQQKEPAWQVPRGNRCSGGRRGGLFLDLVRMGEKFTARSCRRAAGKECRAGSGTSWI